MAVDRRYRARLVPGSRRRSHRLWRRVAPAAVVALVVMPVSLALGAPRVAAAAPAAAVPAAAAAPLAQAPAKAAHPAFPTGSLNQRFHGFNWSMSGDNFQDNYVYPNHLSTSDSYATTYLKATQILTGLKNNMGMNTVRLGINEYTVSHAYWKTGEAATIQAATDLGMNVILSYWSPSHNNSGSVVPCADGTYDGNQSGIKNTTSCYDYPVGAGPFYPNYGFMRPNYPSWWAMWQTVINTYGSQSNVYLGLFNEPSGYSDLETGFVGVSSTMMTDVYAGWLAQFPTFPRDRVMLEGSDLMGDYYLGDLVNDHRLDGTLLSLHSYPAYGLNFGNVADWKTWLRGQLDGGESRTIISEFAMSTSTSNNYLGPADGNNTISYVYALTDLARQYGMGLVLWDQGFDGTSGSGTVSSPFVETNPSNASAVARLKYGFGLDAPSVPGFRSAASASFYTGVASNTFSVTTKVLSTTNPVTSLTAIGPGPGGSLPAGIRWVNNGDGTATITGHRGTIVPGTYGMRFTAVNSMGTTTQSFTLSVVAGAPPAPTTGTLSGRITDTSGHPLANVCPEAFNLSDSTGFNSANYQMCTGSHGTYSFTHVTPGSYKLQFIDNSAQHVEQWLGGTVWQQGATVLTVTANHTTTANVAMAPNAPAITVTPSFTRSHTWGITKDVDRTSAYVASGTITVPNYNDVPLTGVRVKDAVNDPNATCVVTDGSVGVTIPATPTGGAQRPASSYSFPYTCTYSARPASMTETNTATATWDSSDNLPLTTYQFTSDFTWGHLPRR